MPDILELIISVCITAYVLRETFEDLRKKKAGHDRLHHDHAEKQG